eukprot:Tbor_TRINITY_DN5010_c4_g1::TRINITY_DN5010_c4_g1_i1::g.14100::m.14100/K18078/PTPDC1; protein tyrosine phosphatase domain-containing protein 1
MTDVSPKWEPVDERKVDNPIDRARQNLHCSLFCNGKLCKHESWEAFIKQPNVKPAIKGLNSSWVGDSIVASQRPSSSLFTKYPIIQEFRNNNITGVFNLQEKGEHPSCGPDGIYKRSGYSYIAEFDLMKHNICYYEFPWPDMTAPNNEVILRSVQVMDSHIRRNEKILVHCHAGLGRTGLLIACYLIYSKRMSGPHAVQFVRKCRPGAVQTSKQTKFVLDFEEYLNRLFLVFHVSVTDAPVTLNGFIARQRQILHGEDSLPFYHFPYHIYQMLCKCLKLVKCNHMLGIQAAEGLSPASRQSISVLENIKRDLNKGSYTIDSIDDPYHLCFLALEWFRCLSESAITFDMTTEIVIYMKRLDADRDSAESHYQAVKRIFPRHLRHTIAALLSFTVALVKLGRLTPYHQIMSIAYIFDSLTSSGVNIDKQVSSLHRGSVLTTDLSISSGKSIKGSLGLTVRDYLIQFGVLWCRNIGHMYYSDHPLISSHKKELSEGRTVRGFVRTCEKLVGDVLGLYISEEGDARQNGNGNGKCGDSN